MEIQILKENLVKAIGVANRFATTKTQMPILGQLLIEAKKEGIFLTATNLDVSVRLRVAGKVVVEGETAVTAKVMGELVQHLPLGGVSLKLGEQGLEIKAGRVKAKLPVLPASEFPPLSLAATKTGEMEVELLMKSFEKVGFAVSTDESRPVLTGLLWQLGQKQLVATDGYRLSLVLGIEGWETVGKQETLLVPGKALGQVLATLEEFGIKKCDFAFDEQGQQLVFFDQDLKMGVRLLGGDYPQYEAILPKESDFKVEMDREELLEAIRGAVIFARDSANIVKLTLKEEVIEVSANAPQVGENLIEVEAESAKPMEEKVAFNGKYLIDFLTHSQAVRVGMGLGGALKPGLFYEVGNEKYKHVIMPVRVRE